MAFGARSPFLQVRSLSLVCDAFLRLMTVHAHSAKDLQDMQDQGKKMPKAIGSTGEVPK